MLVNWIPITNGSFIHSMSSPVHGNNPFEPLSVDLQYLGGTTAGRGCCTATSSSKRGQSTSRGGVGMKGADAACGRSAVVAAAAVAARACFVRHCMCVLLLLLLSVS